MVRSLLTVACVAALSGGLVPSAANAAGPDTDALAKRLVTAAAVKEGEFVVVAGQARSAELLEDIAVAVRQVGAWPMITIGGDRLGKRLFFDVPERFDSQPDTAGVALAGIVDVTISISDGQVENLMAGADPKCMAARAGRGQAVAAAFRSNNVRSVEVGNGFYPTPWRAERYGMSEAALADTFWQGVSVAPAELQARAKVVSAGIAAGDVLHVTHPNGTDFTVRLKGQKVLSSDGAISAEDLVEGGAALAIYLPAGEVYTTPMAGTANGKIVHSRDYFRGQQMDDVTMQFKDGRMVSMSGSGPGYAEYRANYDAVVDPRKDEFAFVDFGINPDVKLSADSRVGAWIPAGTLTVGTGGNLWAGGDNPSTFSYNAFLPGSTVTLDGKTIIDAGVLKF